MSSTFTGKRTQCPKCAASGLDNKGNNFAEYTDHWYCFACQHYEGKDGVTRTMETDTTFTSTEFKPTKGTVTGLSHRNIDDKTCRLYGYESAKVNGKEVEI